MRLPSGMETGTNTLTFGEPSQSEGILLLTNGNYTATASATIVNGLFPAGIPLEDLHMGTFDFATRRATVQSYSTDLFQLNHRVKFVRTMLGHWVTWTTVQGVLQHTTNVLGPRLTLPNAVSPHAVDTVQFPEQYFRFRGVAP